jgi:hypothetical protein
MKVRLPYYGTNKCELTELFLKIIIIIHDNKKWNMHVNRCSNSWRQKCDQVRSPVDFKNTETS